MIDERKMNDMAIKSQQELINAYYEVKRMSCKPDMVRLSNNYVTDENKSVKWNREQVALNHEEYDKQVAVLQEQKNKAISDLTHEIYDHISDKVGVNLSNQSAEQIWQYFCRSGLTGLDAICELIGTVIKIENTKSKKTTERR